MEVSKYVLIENADQSIYYTDDEGHTVLLRRNIYGACFKEVQEGSSVLEHIYFEEEDFCALWYECGGNVLASKPYPVLWDLI